MGRHETNITLPPGKASSAGRRFMKAGKQWLYWGHRWLGIITCVLCVMWFISGLVMLYVPYPSWKDEERVANLPAVAAERVSITPDQALAAAGIRSFPGTFRLEMLGADPVYRVVAGKDRAAISASTGQRLEHVTREDAQRHLEAVFPDAPVHRAETIDYDQWTVTRRYDPFRPLYKFSLDDGRGTDVYVASTTGEIVQNATRSERFWNWLGAIPHWIYFSPIRRDQEIWRQSVMWLSGPLTIGAITGLWIGILRLRVRRPYSRGRITPYRGWMKWHHIGGLVGGVFLTAWIASGWLSVNPFQLFARTPVSDAQRIAYAGWTEGKDYQITQAAIAEAAGGSATDISFVWIAGKPHILARSASGVQLADPLSGRPIEIPDVTLAGAAHAAYRTANVVAVERLTEEEIYWYSHHNKRPLPVVKVRFDDPSATWLFLDPATGAIAGSSNRSARTYRWMFNFVHDYDLPVLLRNQPARDIIVWLLSIAGLVVSVSGIVVGYRVLKRRSA